MSSAVVTAEPTIGICLSGGGFRAALYGLGVLRYLAEADVLPRARVVCGVSGGSVATAALAAGVKQAGPHALTAGGFVEHILDPFVTAVTCHDIRRQAVGRWAWQRLRPGGRPRNLVLADVLAEALFPGVERLVDLPERPQLLITATDLTNGRPFRFSREFIGSWDYGYVPAPPEMRVATAVAASAAAPPMVPSLQLSTHGLGLKHAPAVLTLTDGGVYDNLGIEWFQGWSAPRRPPSAVPAQDLIVVNASGPLGREEHRLRSLRALNRMRKIQYAQTQATRVRWLVAELEAGRQQGLYFGIVGDPRRYRLPAPSRAPVDPECYTAALPSRLVGALAALRTDFNRFSVHEADLLAYHGYHSAHARFASLRPADAVGEPSWQQFAGIGDADAARLEDGLRGRRHQRGVGDRLR